MCMAKLQAPVRFVFGSGQPKGVANTAFVDDFHLSSAHRKVPHRK